jgi:hypothetical protein
MRSRKIWEDTMRTERSGCLVSRTCPVGISSVQTSGQLPEVIMTHKTEEAEQRTGKNYLMMSCIICTPHLIHLGSLSARVKMKKITYRILVRKPHGKRSVSRPSRIDGYITMDFGELVYIGSPCGDRGIRIVPP